MIGVSALAAATVFFPILFFFICGVPERQAGDRRPLDRLSSGLHRDARPGYYLLVWRKKAILKLA